MATTDLMDREMDARSRGWDFRWLKADEYHVDARHPWYKAVSAHGQTMDAAMVKALDGIEREESFRQGMQKIITEATQCHH